MTRVSVRPGMLESSWKSRGMVPGVACQVHRFNLGNHIDRVGKTPGGKDALGLHKALDSSETPALRNCATRVASNDMMRGWQTWTTRSDKFH